MPLPAPIAPRAARRAAVLGALAALSPATGRAQDAAPRGSPPSRVVVTGHTARRELVENSGAAASATQPGVIFTINDSGNEPLLYATDTRGADRGAWRVTGATNVDWEAVSVGPCAARRGAGRVQPGPPRCLYVGETGDNDARYRTRTIYRVPEPTATGPGRTLATRRAERLTYTYEGGPRDVEAMLVEPDGTVALITKRPLRGADGRLRPALVFRLPAAAWSARGPVVARLADSLPGLVPEPGFARLVTDAALAPDRRHVAVRTYTQLFVFASDARTGRVRAGSAPAVCELGALEEPQGEGVTWLDAERLVLTSEGRGAPTHVVRCPMPK
jgi:hypothetical protein